MGRAMLIIVLGLLVSMGYTITGMTDQRSLLSEGSTNSANKAIAKNIAFTGIQTGIEKFANDNDFVPPKSSPWETEIEGKTVYIWMNKFEHGSSNTEYLNISARAVADNTEHTVVSTFNINEKEQLVPEFNESLGIATNNFNFNLGGSANINGNDKSGQCEDRPGVSVKDEDSKDVVGHNDRIDGSPDNEAKVDSDLDFDAHADLINQLADQPSTEKISGNYKGDLGTKEDPGVFFIEDQTKLSGGISEGYGIMVIRSGGELDYEGDLDVRGNLEFNGLVIFENAYEMDAKGTPTINGSAVVGSTDDTQIDIDISGNVALQYDCSAQQYAELAADEDLDAKRIYKQTSVYQ